MWAGRPLDIVEDVSLDPERTMWAALDAGPVMYVPSMDACASAWFATYDEARAARHAGGGYLLPFRGRFFVAGPEAVRELGLDPADPDWARIGFDWACPADASAWARLRLRREIAA